MKLNRSELREKIMTILYQINMYKKDKLEYDIKDVIKENIEIENDYVNSMVEGTLEKEMELDIIINKYMSNWKVGRLGLIDQAIFRMSCYELMFCDTPNIVCINEAIELSKKYSDVKITNMLNAVLDKILDNEETHE